MSDKDKKSEIKNAPDVPPSPYVLLSAAAFGAVAFTVAVAIFSVQSHLGLYILAAILAVIGGMLVINLFIGESDRKAPSAIAIVFWAVFLSVLWIALLSRLRAQVSSDFIWNGLLIATVAILLSFHALRRTIICILIFVFCYFLSAEFFKSRHDLRSGLVSTPQIFKDATKQMLATRYLGRARTLIYPTNVYAEYATAVDPRNPKVKTLAEEIVRGVNNDDKQELVYRIFKWVTGNIEYRSDPAGKPGISDYIKPPLQTVDSRAGDCDDTSVLLASLLESIGFNTYLIFMPRHVLVLVEIEAGTNTRRLGEPYGYIKGNPVFALESTRNLPRFGAPQILLESAPAEIVIIENVTARVVALDPQ